VLSGRPTLRLRRLLALFVAAVALLGLTAAGTTGAALKPARVTVADFYFRPGAVTIKKGGSVKWAWASTNSYPHDVHLKKGPKVLKNRGSYSTKTTAVTDAHFQKKFTTPGTYRFICTVHPTEMHMTVTVKK
jgi:plastocyanin